MYISHAKYFRSKTLLRLRTEKKPKAINTDFFFLIFLSNRFKDTSSYNDFWLQVHPPTVYSFSLCFPFPVPSISSGLALFQQNFEK